jgi:hypothetical protein
LIPEFQSGQILWINAGVALLNVAGGKAGQTFFDECPSNAAMSKITCDGEMVQISATAIVTTEHGSHHAAALPSQQAQAIVPLQVGFDSPSRIRFAQTHIFRGLPESQDFVVVGDGHL